VLHSFKANEPILEGIISQHGEVRYVNYNEIRGGIDLLVIPNGVGVNPLLAGFSVGKFQSFPQTSLCPKTLAFFEHAFNFYHNNLALPILGIGDGASYLWSHIGGQLATHQGNAVMIKSVDAQAADVNDIGQVISFRHGNLMGVNSITSPKLSEILKNVAFQVMRDVNNTNFEEITL
jgi:hypothetical protein